MRVTPLINAWSHPGVNLSRICIDLACTSWLKLATHIYSLTHYAKGTPSPALCRLQLFVGTDFQYLFHSLIRVIFHLSLTVLITLSVITLYLASEGGPPAITAPLFTFCFYTVSLKNKWCTPPAIDLQGYHLLWHGFPTAFKKWPEGYGLVRPLPRSLATTDGISVDFFSFSY